LRRPRRKGLQARGRGRQRHAGARRQGAGRDRRLYLDAAWGARNKSAVDRFLGATREAKELLAGSEAEWQRLAPRIGVREPGALALYRQRYGEGIFRRPIDEEEADARALYRVLAEVGGTELTGVARELDPGTFYRPGE